MCHTIPYTFHYDYCLFLLDSYKKKEVKGDFVNNLQRLLDKLHVKASKAIATSLYERMSDSNLYYHNPIHILSIFQFASRFQIPLAWWEEIAIWFHDAIHVPNAKSGMNEWASSKFMESMMGPYITNSKLNDISMAILYTAHHEQLAFSNRFCMILDLDLTSFLFEGRECANFYILKEHQHIPNLLNKRKEFLNRLIEKGFVFRTSLMKNLIMPCETQFCETIAMGYIKQLIERCQKGK